MATTQQSGTSGKTDKNSSPVLLRQKVDGTPLLTRSSKRISSFSSDLVAEAKANCIASCSCLVHQPLNVPVDVNWESTKNRQDPDARPLISSKDQKTVYLFYSKVDSNFHLTVITNKPNAEEEIFLTIHLQALTTGDLKYKIKTIYWHQVSVTENGKQRDFVFDLVKDPKCNKAEVFTEKVKGVLHDLEHGGMTNGWHEGDKVSFKLKYAPPFSKDMDDLNTPSGLNRPFMARPSPVDHLQKIVDLLQAAILSGETDKAKQIADRLAKENVSLSIQLNKEEHEKRINEQSISVKVHVEDRETSGCPINMRVKPSDTIGDLKKRMYLQYEFPVEVQRWIIGKRIPKDNETLQRCGIKGTSYIHTLYLYLTTARSAGLDHNQMDAMNAVNRGMASGEMSGDYMTMAALRDGRSRETPSRQSSNLSNVSGPTMSPLSEASDQSSFSASTPLRASVSNATLSQTPSKFKGHGRDQRMSAPELSRQEDTVFTSGPPVASGGLQSGNVPAEKAEETVGWTCPMCTYINKPTRPGCEVCGGDCPPDYKVPIGYVMSKEELGWLKEKEDQQRMMEEARGQRGGEAGNDEQLTEEQLDLILRFNDALTDLQQRQAGQGVEALLNQNVINLPANNLQMQEAQGTNVDAIPRGEDVPDHSLYSLEQDAYVPSDEDNTGA